MKKSIIFFIIFCIFLHYSTNAQPGSSCANPYVINNLPFTQTGMTTAGFPNIYTNTDACNSDYMKGNDFTFSYTPASSQYVNIALSGTGFGVGLFVINGCPNQPGAICVASNTSLIGNPSISNLLLSGGVTYYIIVSTLDPIYNIVPNPSTNFNINITMQNINDVAVIALTSPVSSCSLTANEEVSIDILNLSTNAISNFEVEYKINNANPVTETIQSTIQPGDTLHYTFATTANLSLPGTYQIKAYHKISDDNSSNDTITSNISSLLLINSFPYYEDFENNDGGYATGGMNSSWAWGEPMKPVITHASSPTKCWVTGLTGTYNPNEISYLLFPCLDFTSLTAPVIEFDIWVATTGLLDYCRLEYSKNNGLTWHKVGQQNDAINWYDGTNGWTSPRPDYITVSHRIDSLAGVANAKLRLYFFGNIVTQTDGIAIDNIKIYQAHDNDLGVTLITSPVTNCGLTNNETVTVKIENFGALPQSNFNVSYSVNGTVVATENIASTLQPGSNMIYTFNTTANLSATGAYNIACFTNLTNDGNHNNDTTEITINNLILVNTFPYLENFEASDGGWIPGGLNSSWAWGTPTKPGINHAASPVKCWVTNLTTNANMLETSYLMSPCMDFSSLTLPEIEFNIWYSTSTFTPGSDSIVLHISLDDGNTWTRVGNMNDPFNWYNTPYGWSGNSSGWIHVRHTLPGAGGMSDVRLRIAYYGAFAMMVEGVAIDDIYIHEAPMNDLGVAEIISPSSGCNLSANEYVFIKFTNYGQNPQNNFELKYQINGGPWHTNTFTWDIYPGESIYHTFSQPANLSAQGAYTIRATTSLANDDDHSNDTAVLVVNHVPAISNLPHTEDFETDDGGWYTSGTSSWAWGIPASSPINYAHSPYNAWKTNLNGPALNGEDSYLYSPCYDLSAYDNPWIELYIWHETSPMMGSVATLEASTDGGFFWFIIGYNDTQNWYLPGGIFPGSTSGWYGSSGGWVLKKHALDLCANQPSVRLRIHYTFGQFSMVPEDGIAIDDVKIYQCELPVPSFTYQADGTLVYFTNTSQGGVNFLWHLGDGTTSTTTNTANEYAQPGDYYVTLIAYNECGKDSITQLITVTASGFNEINNEKNISCSPNPNNGIFDVLVNFNPDDFLKMEIFNITGNKVVEEIFFNAKGKFTKKIDLSSFAKGVYYVKLENSFINTIRKIIIH